MSQPSQAMDIAKAVWIALFGLVLVFIVGVIIWALAGPTMAIVIFAVAVLLFVVVPFWLSRRG